jgi:Zinc finger, C2H2 type
MYKDLGVSGDPSWSSTLPERIEMPKCVDPRELDWYPTFSSNASTISISDMLVATSPGQFPSPMPAAESLASTHMPLHIATDTLRRFGKKRTERRHHCTSSGCSLSFVSPKDLRRHVNDRHAKQPRIFKCQSCSSSFKRRDNLARHARNVHNCGCIVPDT